MERGGVTTMNNDACWLLLPSTTHYSILTRSHHKQEMPIVPCLEPRLGLLY